MANPIPVIIDTDVALDDWMATLYLLSVPDYQIIGVTTTGVGAAHLTAGTRNIQGVLATGGQPQIPVGLGTNAPLVYSNVYPGSFRQQVDNAYGLTLPVNNTPPYGSAIALLIDKITGSSSPVTILSIGGGTNLAMAFQEQPQLLKNISRIYMMGGVINDYNNQQTPGNVGSFNPDYTNQVAEWNVFVDPLAAQLVLQSGVPITLIPLNATNQVPLTFQFYTALGIFIAENPSAPAGARLIFDALSTQLSTITAGQYYFWDPLAAVLLANNSFITDTLSTPLGVQQLLNEEQDTSGQLLLANSGPTVGVVMGVDAAAVPANFFSCITGVPLGPYLAKAAARKAASSNS